MRNFTHIPTQNVWQKKVSEPTCDQLTAFSILEWLSPPYAKIDAKRVRVFKGGSEQLSRVS
jgi:hypothetical protein